MAEFGGKLDFSFGMRWLQIILTVLIFCGVAAVQGISFEEDVKITMEQKYAVDKLRKQVAPYITEDFMKDDLYLVKWLRSTNFDIRRSEQNVIANIRWRKEAKIGKIMSEDFSDVAEEYPYMSSGFDKDGRPLRLVRVIEEFETSEWYNLQAVGLLINWIIEHFIVLIGFAGEWDIRSAVVTGRIPRVLRYLDQGLEELRLKIRKLQLEGKNITQAVVIIDLSSFSLVTHGCVQCLLAIVDFLHSYEGHYTGMAHKIFFTNAPPTVQVALEVIRANLSQPSRDAITVFGFNNNHFSAVLQEYIDPKHLPTELGGKLETN